MLFSCVSKQCAQEGVGAREPPSNLADNLLRDFEERWWKHCKEACPTLLPCMLWSSTPLRWLLLCLITERSCWAFPEYVGDTGVQGDEEAMRKLLASSGRVLAHVVDENRRR